MTDLKARIRRLLALAIAAQKSGDPQRARKLLDAAIEHCDATDADAEPVTQQQQQPQPKTKN